MSKLVEIRSITGKCLCSGCPILIEDKYGSCPISNNTSNSTLKGERFPRYIRGDINEHMWCDFKYCGITPIDEDEIKNNPGYRVMGPNKRTMWVPGSIATAIVKHKKIRDNRSKLARIATKR